MIFLTADAFGILPPIARLTRDQAMYWFLSGFTAKLAGTEIGVKEPQPTFSACFGAPFLPQPPVVYARLLAKRLDEHGASVWLVNTGWTGGPYGEGERMPIKATRALLRAAHRRRARRRRVPDGSGLRLRGAGLRAGRRLEPAAAAPHVGRPRGLRRQGARARRHVQVATSPSSTPTRTSSPAARASGRFNAPESSDGPEQPTCGRRLVHAPFSMCPRDRWSTAKRSRQRCFAISDINESVFEILRILREEEDGEEPEDDR